MSWKDQIKIELLDHNGSDEAIANAARVSFQADGSWNSLPDGYTKPQMEKLIKYLANHEHMTPFRHVNISLRCSAPIWLARQLVKHQAGLTWSEVSRRYVDTPVELFDQEFRERPDGSIKQGSGEVTSIVPLVEIGDQMFDISDIRQAMLDWYDRCVDKDGANLAPETVRGDMPLNMMTSWVWTGNLLAFHHMYKLRADAHAQVEAQYFAEQAAEVMKPLFPVAWDALSNVNEYKLEKLLKAEDK